MKGNNSTVKEIPQAVTVGNLNPKEEPNVEDVKIDDKQGYAKTAATSNGLLEFNEVKTWIRDIESIFKDSKGNIISNAYLIIQLLEKKINAYPKKVTNRTMLEEDYELRGYTVLQLNTKDGNLAYGTFHLEFFEGPIFIEELDPDKRLGTVVKITIYPVEYKFPYDGVRNEKGPDYKLIKEDFDSYVVERDDDENNRASRGGPPSQSIKTPQTVTTQHRINKANEGDGKIKKFAEFSRALDPDDKF